MVTHLLDTSAWLAHILAEPEAATITALIADEHVGLGISILSLIEAHARFRAIGRAAEFDEMFESYRPVFERIFIVDEDIALRAITLREVAATRLPAIDSLIAATAAHHHATLVHRDPHFAGLPPESVAQLPLLDATGT